MPLLEPCLEEVDAMSTCSMPPLIPIDNDSPTTFTCSPDHHEYTTNITDLNEESIYVKNKIISSILHLNENFENICIYFNLVEGCTETIENNLRHLHTLGTDWWTLQHRKQVHLHQLDDTLNLRAIHRIDTRHDEAIVTIKQLACNARKALEQMEELAWEYGVSHAICHLSIQDLMDNLGHLWWDEPLDEEDTTTKEKTKERLLGVGGCGRADVMPMTKTTISPPTFCRPPNGHDKIYCPTIMATAATADTLYPHQQDNTSKSKEIHQIDEILMMNHPADDKMMNRPAHQTGYAQVFPSLDHDDDNNTNEWYVPWYVSHCNCLVPFQVAMMVTKLPNDEIPTDESAISSPNGTPTSATRIPPVTPTSTGTAPFDLMEDDIQALVNLLDTMLQDLPSDSRFRSFFQDVAHFAHAAAARTANESRSTAADKEVDHNKENKAPSDNGKFTDSAAHTTSQSANKPNPFLSRLVGSCSSNT